MPKAHGIGLAPARVFDKQIRKFNRLAGVRQPTLAANGGNAPAASPRLP